MTISISGLKRERRTFDVGKLCRYCVSSVPFYVSTKSTTCTQDVSSVGFVQFVLVFSDRLVVLRLGDVFTGFCVSGSLSVCLLDKHTPVFYELHVQCECLMVCVNSSQNVCF